MKHIHMSTKPKLQSKWKQWRMDFCESARTGLARVGLRRPGRLICPDGSCCDEEDEENLCMCVSVSEGARRAEGGTAPRPRPRPTTWRSLPARWHPRPSYPNTQTEEIYWQMPGVCGWTPTNSTQTLPAGWLAGFLSSFNLAFSVISGAFTL